MTETELERIVVRLVGDGSSYQAMLKTAADSSTAAANQVKQAADRIEGLKNSLTGFASQAVTALGAFGVATSLQGAFDGFSKLEQTQIRLRNIIVATGQALEPTMARFNRFSNQMTESTNVTRGETLALVQRATAMGLNAEQAEKVSRNAIALAGITGRESSGMIRVAAAIERGNYQMARRVLGLQGVKDETELVRIVNSMMTAGMQTQIQVAQTASGRLERLGRSLKFIGIEIGGMIAGAIIPLAEKIQGVINWFKSLDSSTKKVVTGVVGLTLGYRSLMPMIGMLPTVLGPLIPLFKGLWAAMLGPWGLVAAGIAIAIHELGGLEQSWKLVSSWGASAWKYIKASMSEFLEWASPIWTAFSDLASATWQGIRDFAVSTWTSIEPVVRQFFNGVRLAFGMASDTAKGTWNEIREVIVGALLRAEWVVRNFKQAWNIAVTATALAMMEMKDLIIQGFRGAFNWIEEKWIDSVAFVKTVWAQATNKMEEVGQEMGTSVSNWFMNRFGESLGFTRAAIDLTISQGNASQRAANAARTAELQAEINRITTAQRAAQAILNQARAGNNGDSPLQRDLRRQLDAQLAAANQSFETFRRQRQDAPEIAVKKKTLAQAEAAGEQLGGALAHGVKKGLEKLDAVARYSAEAFGRIAAYRDRILGQEVAGGPGAPAVAAAGNMKLAEFNRQQQERLNQKGGGGAVAVIGQGQVVALLGQIAGFNRQIAERNPAVLLAADLG